MTPAKLRAKYQRLAQDLPWRCDCPDSAYRPGIRCKHVVAVYFARQLAAPVRRALQTAVGAS